MRTEAGRGARALALTAAASAGAPGLAEAAGALSRLAQEPLLRLLNGGGGASPPHGQPRDAAAAAGRRQMPRWHSHAAAPASRRAFGSSAAARAGGSERGYAQAAYAPAVEHAAEEPQAATPEAALPGLPSAQPAAANDLLGRAHAAAATLKARAAARLEEAARLDGMQGGAGRSPFGARVARARQPTAGEPLQLTRVPREEDAGGPEHPLWDRLALIFSAHEGDRWRSSAALAGYRQEVLRGQDPDVVHTGGSGGFVHVPFLRSGMFAAHQGWGLASDLSRQALRSRLPAAAAAAEASARTSAALERLRDVMDASRCQKLRLSPGDAAVLASLAPGGAQPPPGFGWPPFVAGGQDEAEAAHDEEDLEELAAWEARHAEHAEAARLEAQAAERARRSGMRLRPPLPAADRGEVAAALGALPGVATEAMAKVVAELYARCPRCRSEPLLPLEPLPADGRDAAGSLAGISAMADALLQDLGPGHFSELLRRAPWVLLLDAERQGHATLHTLHLVDMGAAERGALLAAYPRLLTVDADAHLLPLLAYLQGLGMSNQQICRMVTANPKLCQPNSLEALKAVAAFWLGRGMTRAELALMLSSFPTATTHNLATWQFKFDWLADHTGFTVQDVALLPWFAGRSLTENFGPRVAFALSKGIQLARPSETAGPAGLGSQRHRRGPREGRVHLQNYLRGTERAAIARLRADPEEFRAFKEAWQRHTFPAWLEQRQGGIERYRALTGSRASPRHGAAPPEQPPPPPLPPGAREAREPAAAERTPLDEQALYLQQQAAMEAQADYCEWREEELAAHEWQHA